MNILVADDDITTRTMIAGYLERRGVNVMTAADGAEAENLLSSRQVDIAVLDWIMPVSNGIEISRAIRGRQTVKYIYIILLTSKEGDNDLLMGYEAGVDEYLNKPISMDELYARIKAGMRIVNLEQTLRAEQKKLEDLIEIKNRFLGIAAHDLRNPVISIRGFSKLLLKKSDNFDEEQKEFASIIYSASNNMLELLGDLLDLSRIETGDLDLRLEKKSLKPIIEERIELYRLQAENKRIAICADLSDPAAFFFDPGRITQAVDNLISNAIKFSPQGTRVDVRLEQDEHQAIFSVQDQGPGIANEEQKLLFKEFQRLSVRPTGGESSTGLGLAITRKIVEFHKGTICFESKVGIGSTFSFQLPLE